MASEALSFAIHATAVAIGDWSLVIRGPSKAGKSTLALYLIAASAEDLPIMLVGDDRLIVSRRGADVFVAPHPRIAGLIEQRGVGIVRAAYRTNVPVRAVVDLGVATSDGAGGAASCDFAGQNFPCLRFVKERMWNARHARILGWVAATSVAHPSLKCAVDRPNV